MAPQLAVTLAAVEIGILGPLRLTVDGEQRTVPPGRQGRLLAVLALHADQVVAADRLVDVVWGDDLPADPANALQWRISQLRKLLGRQAVSRQSAGYRLHVDPAAVDAHRFEQLARQGHDRLAADEPHGAVAVLDEALGLWRGDVLAEFADELWARGEAARLQERWLTATEDRFEAALELGRHAAVLPELEAAVDQHPWRERLRRLLMLALYRDGRQTDALEVYEHGRRVLGEEFGLDPDPQLQQLQRDILGHAEHLAHQPSEAPSAPRSNLPARLTSFVGREEHVVRLRSLLERSRLVTLTGPGGAGKSRLAIETADRLRPPDGVWLVELASVADPDDVVAAIADALDLTGSADLLADTRDLRAELIAALSRRRLLLVLDNCEHVIDVIGGLTVELLGGCPELTVLATSREPLGVTGEVTWSVPSLPSPEDDSLEAVRGCPAAQLFIDRLSSHRSSFELDEPAAASVAAICRRLDGIPLALELASARGRALGVQDIAAGLDDRFTLLGTGERTVEPRHRTLQAVIDWSWELLDDEQRRALAVLSVFAGRFTLSDAERLLGATVCESSRPAQQLLPELADRSLLEAEGQDTARFRMLETIREYARSELDRCEVARDPRTAHAEMMADEADRLEPTDPSCWELDLSHIEGKLDDVRAALHRLLDLGDTATAQRLAGALGWCWWLRGRRAEGSRWLTSALADGVHDDRAALWAGFIRLGDPEAAVGEWLEQASRSTNDTVATWADAFRGMQAAAGGDPDDAARQLAAAGERAAAIGGWPQAMVLLLDGVVAFGQGHLDRAEPIVGRAEELFTQTGAWWGRLFTSDVLAHIAQARGDYADAAERREQMLQLAQRHGMIEAEAAQSLHLGNLAALHDEYERAREHHQRALRLAERSRDRSLVALASNGAGMGARRRGDLDAAEQLHRRAAELYDRLQLADGAAFAHAGLGFVADQRGDREAALHAHRSGLERARHTGDPRAVALALEGVAGALTEADPRRAAQLLGAAEQIRDDVGASLPAPERADVDRIGQRLSEALGDRCATLVDQGRSLSIDAAQELAAA